MTHPVPLRDHGTLGAPADRTGWAARSQAAQCQLGGSGRLPPVPALTAEQVLGDALNIQAGEQLLVHGAGGVTGGLLVALGSLRGAQVIATAGPASQQRVSALGARQVIDYHDQEWPEQVRAITGRHGVAAAVNAAPSGASSAIRAVADGGRLATITLDPPSQQRGITVSSVYSARTENSCASSRNNSETGGWKREFRSPLATASPMPPRHLPRQPADTSAAPSSSRFDQPRKGPGQDSEILKRDVVALLPGVPDMLCATSGASGRCVCGFCASGSP